MPGFLSQCKPSASRRTHLLFAALLWTIAGSILLARAWRWTGMEHYPILLSSFVVGTCKALFLVDRSAKKTIARNMLLNDGSCLGAVYSFKMWFMVVFMIGAGVLLRNSHVSELILGFLYGAIGWALLFSTRLLWRAWYEAN